MPRLGTLPFDSERKCMTVIRTRGGQPWAFVKGAPEVILARCAAIRTSQGVEALTENDRLYLRFADAFEKDFIAQGSADRSIQDALTLGWKLLSMFPKGALTRISRDHVDKYYFGEQMERMYRPGEIPA